MKLVLAIVQDEDSGNMMDELNANGVFDKFPQNQKTELTINAIMMNLSLYNDGNLAATHFEENNGVEIMVQAQCDEQSITDAVAYVTQGVSDEEIRPSGTAGFDLHRL